MDVLIALLLLAVLAAIALGFARGLVARVTVYEYERGLRYLKGAFRDQLAPGRYWVWKPSTAVHKVDVRPAFATIPGQEVLAADGVSIRLSLAAEYELTDPATAVNGVVDYFAALYLNCQLAVREVVAGSPIEELLARRGELGTAAAEIARPKLAEIGVGLRSLEVKDIMFPGPLKRVFAQVVEAREEGRAALEKARGETAALRSLANAARLVDDNPALFQLRLLQQLAGSQGNTVVLGLPTSTTPLPLRGRTPDVELPPQAEAEPGES